MWFIVLSRDAIARITPSAAITEWSRTGGVKQIVSSPDGNLYFIGADDGQSVSQVTTEGAVSSELLIPNAARATIGPDGALWMLIDDGRLTRLHIAAL